MANRIHTRRSNWSTPSTESLKVEEFVLAADESTPKGHFPIAHIVRLRVVWDCVARSAVVKTSSDMLVHPRLRFGLCTILK